jgi:hydroxyacylglutathione hydrolase
MNLVALPAFADNYIWMLHDGRQALVVDPGDETPVLEALRTLDLVLTGILVTHHHADHVGGIEALRPVLRGPVWGPAGETVPGPSEALSEGDEVEWNGLRFAVIDVPGHTAGHIAFACLDAPGGPVLFCGDTLFSAGCGRLFEGTAAQMHASLGKLARLPGDTRVCCAHEYTLSNLRFARAVEAGNAAITEHMAHCEKLRAAGRPTLPSSIALEL